MAGLRIGSVCSGYRGLDAAVEAVFGGTTAWVSDIDPGANKILAHHWPNVPNHGDLTTTDWAAVEPVDIYCGGYPCQPFSAAGLRKGIQDERHIWPYIAQSLRVLRPRVAIFENVRGHLRRGFDTVLADLAGLGFDAEWCVVRASEVGAPHPRERLFILAVAQDADGELGDQWRVAASGQTEAGGARSDTGRRGRASAADPGCGRLGEHGELSSGRNTVWAGVRDDAPRCNASSAADADGNAAWEQPVGQPRHVSTSVSELLGSEADAPDWGRFEPAIRRWEYATGRRAPWATDDRNRLSPPFVEWLMGLPAGHVTDVPDLSRNQQLHALGNGVVPQQAEAAIRLLATRAGLLTGGLTVAA